VQPQLSFDLVARIPDDCIAVSESGLRTPDELQKLKAAGFDALLIGEHLMFADDPGAALSALLAAPPAGTSVMIRVKICGITNARMRALLAKPAPIRWG